LQPEAIALQKWRTSKMKVTIKKLSVLKHPEKNVRIHSEQQIRELKRSLEKFFTFHNVSINTVHPLQLLLQVMQLYIP